MFKGIDISKHNGDIDFCKIKSEIDFIIIRCAYRGIKNRKIFTDEKFKNNIIKANKYNIPVGVYIYSTAINEKEAIEEANYCVELVKSYNIEYPIIIDVEDSKNQGSLDKKSLSNIISSFCQEVEKNGYYPMYYCSEYWLNNKIDYQKINKYDLWIAKWSDISPKIKHEIWQYTDCGIIEGIKGKVDLNYSQIDYSKKSKYDKNKVMIFNEFEIGDYVMFEECYISSDSIDPLIPLIKRGTITRIIKEAKNPYLIDEGLCWIRKGHIIQ